MRLFHHLKFLLPRMLQEWLDIRGEIVKNDDRGLLMPNQLNGGLDRVR